MAEFSLLIVGLGIGLTVGIHLGSSPWKKTYENLSRITEQHRSKIKELLELVAMHSGMRFKYATALQKVLSKTECKKGFHFWDECPHCVAQQALLQVKL